MADMPLSLVLRLPWWWRLYLGAVVVAHNIGVIVADAEVAAGFVVRHAHLYTKDARGRRRYLKAL